MLRVRYLIWYAMFTIVVTGLSTDMMIAFLVKHGMRLSTSFSNTRILRHALRISDLAFAWRKTQIKKAYCNDNTSSNIHPDRKLG